MGGDFLGLVLLIDEVNVVKEVIGVCVVFYGVLVFGGFCGCEVEVLELIEFIIREVIFGG